MQTQEHRREPSNFVEPLVPPSEPLIPPAEPLEQRAEPLMPEPAPKVVSEPSLQTKGMEEEETDLTSEFEEKLNSAEAKAAEMHQAFLRAKAELENVRRRLQEDIARAHKFAIEEFAESLVSVKDSLETALKVEAPSVDSLKEGVELTLKQLHAAFEKNRLTEVNPIRGEKLDPMRHQAISMMPAEQNANTVVSVLQKGYMIADRLLRPALVTVAQENPAPGEG